MKTEIKMKYKLARSKFFRLRKLHRILTHALKEKRRIREGYEKDNPNRESRYTPFVVRSLVIGWRDRDCRTCRYTPERRGSRDSPDAAHKAIRKHAKMRRKWRRDNADVRLHNGRIIACSNKRASKPHSNFSLKTTVVYEIHTIPALGVLDRVTNLALIRLADAAAKG